MHARTGVGTARICAIAFLLVAAACSSAPSTNMSPGAGLSGASNAAADTIGSGLGCDVVPGWELSGGDAPPIVLNGDEVKEILTRQFRGRALGKGLFQTTLRMRVTVEGRVDRVCVVDGSGSGAFDEAAVSVASLFRFRPGTLGGEPVASNVQFPIAVRIR